MRITHPVATWSMRKRVPLLAAPFDLAALKLTGAPVPVVDDVRMTASGTTLTSVSRETEPSFMCQAASSSGRGATLVWVDREGKAESIADHTTALLGPKVVSRRRSDSHVDQEEVIHRSGCTR